MAEPIRKPVHRPRPPHPHTQRRSHAVIVRSRELVAEETEAERNILPRPRPASARPALVPAPPPAAEPVLPPPAALSPPDDESLSEPRAPEERSGRSLLLTALALHLGVLLTAWIGQATPGLDSTELLLSGAVLLSGGFMLALGARR